MKNIIFKGAATALITPFADGKLDVGAFSSIIAEQLNAGIDALVVCGTTGEAPTMRDTERFSAISLAVNEVNGKIPVIAGAGSNDTSRAKELCVIAAEAGADALLVVCPYYNKTSRLGLVKMYEDVASKTDLPVVVYNVPSRTGMDVDPDTYAALAQIPAVCAVKEASTDMVKIGRAIARVGDTLAFYSGCDELTVPMMALGARGVISVLSNIDPRGVREMCRSAEEGDFFRAGRAQLEFLPLISALFSEVNPIPVKEAMALLGKCRREMRAPLYPLDEKSRGELKSALCGAGFDL